MYNKRRRVEVISAVLGVFKIHKVECKQDIRETLSSLLSSTKSNVDRLGYQLIHNEGEETIVLKIEMNDEQMDRKS